MQISCPHSALFAIGFTLVNVMVHFFVHGVLSSVSRSGAAMQASIVDTMRVTNFSYHEKEGR